MTADHSRTTGDARKRLEQAIAESNVPFIAHPACALMIDGFECGRRYPHTHWSPIYAEYPGEDPT